MTLLVAKPRVYTEQPDEIPELLSKIRLEMPYAVLIELPRGMASPKRWRYTAEVMFKLTQLGYAVAQREQRNLEDKKRLVILARRDGRGLRWGSTLVDTIGRNDS